MLSLLRILLLCVMVWTSAASAQQATPPADCMQVTMQEAVALPGPVSATVSIANCVPSGSIQLGLQVDVTSSNTQVAIPASANVPFDQQTTVTATINLRAVTTCLPVDITFTSMIGGTSLVVVKPLTVCPFLTELIVTNAQVIPPVVAGRRTQMTADVASQGSLPLFNSYRLRVSTVEDMTGLVYNQCPGGGPLIDTGIDEPSLLAGQIATADFSYVFPQAGNFTAVVAGNVSGSEDGPAWNNRATVPVTVDLPRPLICDVTGFTGNGTETVTVAGNWFKTYRSNEQPTVSILGRNGEALRGGRVQVISVPSPLQLQFRTDMSGLSCRLAGSLNVGVSNRTGRTLYPVILEKPVITSTQTGGSGREMTINLAHFRNNCTVTARLQPAEINGQSLAVGGPIDLPILRRTANSVTVQLPAPPRYTGLMYVFTYHVQVVTPYGTATSREGYSIAPVRPRAAVHRCPDGSWDPAC